ncbi:7SK snRNA methylphosphate capping enzyme [Marchantia polymorpha subsp. ruderalis]
MNGTESERCARWARRRMNDSSMGREVPVEAEDEEKQLVHSTGVGFCDGDMSAKRKRKKPAKKEVQRFGNYHHYYGYRLGKSLDVDPRLNVFEPEWFEGMDCLDIGCNEGIVTISIAQKYNCRSILGLDIDEVLIRKAQSNLIEEAALQGFTTGEYMEPCEAKENCSSDSENTLDNGWWKETIAWRELTGSQQGSDRVEDSRCATERAERSTPLNSNNLLRRVTFRKENVIKDFPHGDYMKDGTFDTVLCLSMTKWVHLNWGDDGLVRLFAKIYHILRPGGILILEPQPWNSYRRKAKVCEVTRQNFNEIKLRPNHFTEILLDKIGFKSYKEVSTAVPGSTAGFDRSLYVYVK